MIRHKVLLMIKQLTPAILLLGAATLAHAQFDTEMKKPSLGLRVGAFFPSDSFIRDKFGNGTVSIGATVMGSQPRKRTRTFTDFDVVGSSKDGSKFVVVPVTFGYEMQFIRDDYATTVPYVRAQVGAAYYDYAIDTAGGRVANKRIGPAGAFEAGVNFNDRLQVSAKYNIFGEADGLNFNGLTLQLSYAVTRF